MYVVKSMTLAGYLLINGFCIRAVEPDRNNPNYNVFKFDDCPKLREQITIFTKLKHSNLI